MMTSGRLLRVSGGTAATIALAVVTLVATGNGPARAVTPQPPPSQREVPAASVQQPAAVPAASAPAGQEYGPASGMHIQVMGSASSGYQAGVYDGGTFVTGRGMAGPYDLTVLPGPSRNGPVGGNLFSVPTAQLGWAGPFQLGVGKVAGTVEPATTADGQSAVHWAQPGAAGQTWIQVTPSGLVSGQRYRASITLQGQGQVFLDFYDGAQDNATSPVTLSSTPQTLSLDVTIPASHQFTPVVQVRTAASGDVDLLASQASLFQIAPLPVGAANELTNRYRSVSWDPAKKTLTLAGAVDSVGPATVTRFESYRFVGPEVIDARVGVSTSGSPVVLWYSPYTDFPASWQPMWVGGDTRSYDSPDPTTRRSDESPIPVLGASDGKHTYGVASGADWDYPTPGYFLPHISVDGNRLAAPQIGTSDNPVSVPEGSTRTWQTVFFRGANSTYGLALAGELAMAEAQGFASPDAAPSAAATEAVWTDNAALPALRNVAGTRLGDIAQVTAYWLRGTDLGSGAPNMTESAYYSPIAGYMRDNFWTSYGLAGTPYAAPTETPLFEAYTNAVSQTGPDAGQVPTSSGGGSNFDEGGLYYLIRMYRDVGQWGLPVKNLGVAQLVLDYIQAHQVVDGTFRTAAPEDIGGFTISPDTWLDGYLFPAGAVSGYDQGLYVVALEAAQRLGLDVSDAQVSQAISGYRALYEPDLGFVRWLSTANYKGPDVLAGDALALKLFNQPLLTNQMVAGTLAAQARTPNGVKALATQDGGYVPADQFRTLTTNSANQVIALDEPGGWYQNGGSWFLWEYLAEYAAARQGDAQAAMAIGQSVAAEVAVTPMMKEFKATAADPGIGSVDPDWPYPLGSSGLSRQGYGWDAAFAAFQPTLSHGVG